MVNSNRIINSPLSFAHNIPSVGNKLQLCIHSETKISCDALEDWLLDPDLVSWNFKILVLQQNSTDAMGRVMKTGPRGG